MDTLIVYAHPYEGSFCHAMLEAHARRLEREGLSYEIADLYADGFNPALSREELAVYNQGGVLDPLVERYQQQVLSARRLILICPIWWNDIPAMLRGWFDKVMLIGSAWTTNENGNLIGKLDNIERVDVYTTSASPTSHTRDELGNAIEGALIDGTLWQLGIAGRIQQGKPGLIEAGCAAWHNLGSVDSISNEERSAWLHAIEFPQG